MLSSYKSSHEKCADALITEDWRKMNKNKLVNRYLEVEKDKDLANAYLSAIIVRYWGALSKYYNSSYKVVDKMTCYDWLVDAIMRALDRRKWLDPTSTVYNDPYGPDKVINRCIISERLGYFQSSNTYKRKNNYGLESLERLQDKNDSLSDIPTYMQNLLPTYTPEELDEGNISISSLVEKAFDDKEYVLAFMVDGIVNYNTFEVFKDDEGKKYSNFSEKRLMRHLRALNSNYCQTFSNTFHKPLDEVEGAVKECGLLSRARLKTAVQRNMKKLKRKYEKLLEEY